ncbi:hypothetical protein HK104_004976 [Borealophlyctis nickersoniae]|nr:hypothetical protein HK104_004976 [Borealophlyctis nickersoniae]
MADNDSGTVEEAGTAAEEDLRADSDQDVTSTTRMKPTESRPPLHSEPQNTANIQNPAKILARIPVFTKFLHPRVKKPKAGGESDTAKAAERNMTEGTWTYGASTNPNPKVDLPNLHDDIFPLIARTAAPREAAKLCRLSRLHAQLITKKDLSWAAAGFLWTERMALNKSKWKAVKTVLRTRTGADDIPSLPKLYKRLYKRFPAVPVACAARILEGLFVLGANINVEGSDAVLEDAIERGHEPVVRTLVKGGIDIHANMDQALCQASKLGRYDICDILIKSGANVNAQRGLPLLYAAEFGYAAVCKLLVEAGAQLKQDENDLRLLAKAADKGHVDVVRTLLDLGGDIFTNVDFKCALALADCCGSKGLRYYQASDVVKDNVDSTGSRVVSFEEEGALLRAARIQDDCIIHILLINGAGRLSWVLNGPPRKRKRARKPFDPVHCLYTDCARNYVHAKQLPFYEDQDDGEGTGQEN